MIVIILPDIPSEDRLLTRARQGDQDALREIYESYFDPIFSFVRLRVDELQVAEDIAGDVFLKLLEACRNRKAPHHSLRGWLFRVARNTLHDYYGKKEKITETTLSDWLPLTTGDDIELEFIRRLDVENARWAIKQLSFDQQEVIILRFAQALSLQETADIMGKQANAIKALQFRAVRSLRRILEEMRTEYTHD
jgi:RNA polymerase sigma-70 factor (ECF subfamily)